LEKVSTIEFFDIGYDTNTVATFATKLIWPGLEDNEMIKLYRDFAAPCGVGVSACSDFHGVPPDFSSKQILGNNVTMTINSDGSGLIDPGWGRNAVVKIDQSMIRIIQSMDRAKTTLITNSQLMTPKEVVTGFQNRRSIASRYHETFDSFTINGENWAPGKWKNNVECTKNVRIDLSVQFHEGKDLLENKKEVVIIRNGKRISDEIATLNEADKLNYSYTDENLVRGTYQYIIFVGGLELSDKAQERIVTSPIYVKVLDKKFTESTSESIGNNKREISIFKDLIHLGDSNYTTPLNVGFAKRDDEGIFSYWIMILPVCNRQIW
jgi:hypothetical protein